MYEGLLHAHSGFRWLVLLALLFSIYKAWSMKSAGENGSGKWIYLFTLILTHIQLLIGLGLYFMSQKVMFSSDTMSNSVNRFFTVEHTFGMVIAITLITLGYRAFKKSNNHKKIFNYYLIALIVMLLSIPWPFRNLGAGWF